MNNSDGVGQQAMAIYFRRLGRAAEELAAIEEARKCLKPRSGEHLAAILLTAFFDVVPIAFDGLGEPDLVFDITDLSTRSWWPVENAKCAFEIKSLDGPYRKWESRLDPTASKGETLRRTVVSGKQVIENAMATVRIAAESLASKCPADYSKSVFIVVHPFDHFAGDVMQSVIASHLLPAPPTDLGLDSVWVLWAPDNLTMWSAATQSWTEMIFWACNEDEAREQKPDPLSVLQNAEARYLELSGDDVSSPYLFGIASEDTRQRGSADD